MFEVKKIMLHQRGLLYIALVLLLSTLWLALSDSPYNSQMEQWKTEYEWYLNKVRGYCTEESSLYLEEEAKSLAETREKQADLLERFYDGQISESTYKQEMQETEMLLEHERGFEVIYQQYLYICENTENRCFLRTNGWMGLLGGGTLHLVLFLGILLLTTPVFCSEYSCQMDALILTAREGQKSVRSKLLLTIGTVLFLCVSISLLEYAFYSVRYGLPNGDYPIQSIPCFRESHKDISLFHAYVCVGLLRLFGGVFLAVFLMFVSVLAKRYAITLLTGAASVLLPYMGLSETIIYRLPLPLPFLLGTGFFTGDMVSRDALTGDEKIIFAEVDMTTLLILLLVSALLCTLAIAGIFRCNRNKWQMKLRKGKHAFVLAATLILTLTLTGCFDGRESKGFVYNSSADYDGMGYEIMQDTETFDYYLKNTSTGKAFSIPRSPIFGAFSEEEKVLCYCMCPPYLYYTTSVTESYVNRVGNYNSDITKVSVVELNLETFEEKIVFEQVTNSGRSLFGIDYETGDQWQFLDLHYAFFLNSDSIFFIGNDGITQVSRRDKGIEKLNIPTNGTISFDGECIFYQNERSLLTRYDVAVGETYVYETIAASDFCMDEQFIYYVSRTDGGCVYACGKDGGGKELISDIPAMSVTCDAKNIYVLAKESGKQIVLSKYSAKLTCFY